MAAEQKSCVIRMRHFLGSQRQKSIVLTTGVIPRTVFCPSALKKIKNTHILVQNITSFSQKKELNIYIEQVIHIATEGSTQQNRVFLPHKTPRQLLRNRAELTSIMRSISF